MGQFKTFIIHHWAMVTALIVVLIMIFVNELKAQRSRGKELPPQAAIKLINDDNAVVIDLRDAENYRKGHIIDSIRASQDDFEQNKMDKYKDKPIILVCGRGLQSAALAAKLRTQGFVNPVVLAGGISAWQAADLPLVKGK
ncbi:rhodanese-like domain-containing protein [Legionella taurinensis]|uniref:Rhodanese-like domain-containing protein n=1 Tax=Legionella taurinensis TaxID=70611 RepID=A0A3A5L7G7_9GAMM|nr:rhodanese-like domain-containing protein [Legionella taurinensis]MDX1836457.1 rhodanese-like domain-containing protein [Legionella taurinensis]PUT43072.1 rhodanese-like domain-containing protein [Legionella taurinensis]PUT45111.1 rhodanese-like domain-containing protein [Legionella taurinensis]PUT45627.1 rhodanese-like domain-containing protein [Legionella taurinensis]PUT49396.1 rhodanese-like domain-containing protein [Legionella taurinensis]